MMDDTKKFAECFECEFIEKCTETIEEPDEYEDGFCKTKDLFIIEKLKEEKEIKK